MKFIHSHKDFAEYVKETFDLDVPEEEIEKIDEAFQNDVTLSNSLIGQLFGWIFRKIGGKIKKGQMKALLEELANEFGKGQYKAVQGKRIAKKNTLYSNIVGLKRELEKDDLDMKQFNKKLDAAIEEIRLLVEGKGDTKIEDDNVELMKVAKDFYKKLNMVVGDEFPEEEELDVEELNIEDEANLEDETIGESMGLKIPNGLYNQLSILEGGKIDVISINIESQLSEREVYHNEDSITIEDINEANYNEIEEYFRKLNIAVELINDTVSIKSYDRLEYLLEYDSTKLDDILFDLSASIGDVLYAPVKIGSMRTTVNGVGFSTESDVKEKGNVVYKAVFDAISGESREGQGPIDFAKYLNIAQKIGDKTLIKDLEDIINSLNKFKESQGDVSAFKLNFNALNRGLNSAHGYIESKIKTKELAAEVKRQKGKEQEAEQKATTTDTNVELTFDKEGKLSVNVQQFNKLGKSNTTIKYLDKNDDLKQAKININQPEDIEEKIGYISVIGANNTVYAIDGAKVREVGGIPTPKGILNRGHEEERRRRELGKEERENWLSQSRYLIGHEVEVYKTDAKGEKVVDNQSGEYVTREGTVSNYETQQQKVSEVGSLWVDYAAGGSGEVKNILDNIKTKDGKEWKKEESVDRAKLLFDNLFPNDKDYERELKISEREKKDLLDTIEHKAKSDKTLINPLQVMKIFNNAHYKYTVDNYNAIPDGSQGSTLQGKGKGVNKRKNYQQMPDGSGRHVALFKQWNEGVIDLLQQYGDYIPDKLKKFIINVLNDNTIFGKGGAQAKLLADYFGIKVDIDELGIGEGGRGAVAGKKTTKTDIYINTNDATGVFKKPESGALQLKKENFEKVPFIMKGNQRGQEPTAYVCYYMGTVGNLVLFKFKTNNLDFLNNYKRDDQQLAEQQFQGAPGTEVRYGAIPIPKGANKDLKIGSETPIWFTDINLQGDVEGPGNFGIDDLFYLQGEKDGGVMRLDTKRPSSEFGDVQHEDFKVVQQKFSNIKA